MTGAPRCFLDANVLASTWATDVFLTLAEEGLVEPRWSRAVLGEAKRAFQRMHREGEWADRYLAEISSAFPHATVDADAGYPAALGLPDPGDLHVVAAAKAGGCPVIVTYNLKDFPADILHPMGIRAEHPDEFLVSVAELDPEKVFSVVCRLVAAKRHPPRSLEEEIGGLRAVRLVRFAGMIEDFGVGRRQYGILGPRRNL